MKVLISTQFFQTYVGGEIFVLDLAHGLLKRGHQVRIHAGSVGELYNILDERIIVSMRKTVPVPVDVIIAMHPMFSQELVDNTDAPAISIMHSEHFSTDAPILHERVKRHVVVDESIVDHAISVYGINPIVVKNGIDLERFKPSSEPKEYGFVPGAINFTRIKMAESVIRDFPDEKILFAGHGTNIIQKQDRFIFKGPIKEIEQYYSKAKWVAGLFNGRVQYEAWACGLEYYAYDVQGNKIEVSKPEDFQEQFSLETMIDRYEELLASVVGERNAGNIEEAKGVDQDNST